MKAKFKIENRIDSSILFKKLKSISNVNDEGRVTFDAIEFLPLEWVFLALIDFGDLYSIESRKAILFNTFSQLVIKNIFDKLSFYEVLNNQIKLHNKKQETDYYLLTSLSIKELPIRRINLDNSQIIISGRNFPDKFKSHRNNIIRSTNENEENSDYIKIIVKVKARDFKDGFEKAYKSLEVFRSFLCLILNSHFELRFGKNSENPINKVRKGKFSSLHLDNGVCLNDNCWYETNFIDAKPLEIKVENVKKIKVNLRGFIKKFNLCSTKHKKTIAKALNIYVSAFDEPNKFISFLGAWTALESILNTDQNDVVIKRSIALFHEEDKPFQKQWLEALKNYRNEYVHEGGNSLDPLMACFKIQELIFNLIIKFNLKFAGFFNNIEESTMFLDNYSPTLNELKARKRILDKAIKLKKDI